jgi:hypothetical protein
MRYWIKLLFILYPLICWGEISDSHNIFIKTYPVIIKGRDFPFDMNHYRLSKLCLMSMQSNRLKSIPFQIDQFDTQGMIYVANRSKFPLNGQINRFNAYDELVFMLHDTATQSLPADQLKGKKIVAEIELVLPNREKRWAYLIENSQCELAADYVKADLPTGRIETTSLLMQYDPANFARVQSITSTLVEPSSGNLLNTLQLTVGAGLVINKLHMQLSLDKNIKAIPIAVHDGSVRASVLLKTQVEMMGMTLYTNFLTVNYYPYSINLPTRFAVNSAQEIRYFLFLLKQPRIDFSLTSHAFQKGYIQFAALPDRVFNIPHQSVNPNVFTLSSKSLPGDWLNLQSKQGLKVFFYNPLASSNEGVQRYFLQGTQYHLRYKTNQESVEIGAQLMGLPTSAMDFLAALHNFKIKQVKDFNDALTQLITSQNQNAFKQVDKVIQKIINQLKQQGEPLNVQVLADKIIADISEMGIRGIDTDHLRILIHHTLATQSLEHFSFRSLLIALKSQAKLLAIDLSKLTYYPIDNTLWVLPKSNNFVPSELNVLLKNPPKIVINQR